MTTGIGPPRAQAETARKATPVPRRGAALRDADLFDLAFVPLLLVVLIGIFAPSQIVPHGPEHHADPDRGVRPGHRRCRHDVRGHLGRARPFDRRQCSAVWGRRGQGDDDRRPRHLVRCRRRTRCGSVRRIPQRTDHDRVQGAVVRHHIGCSFILGGLAVSADGWIERFGSPAFLLGLANTEWLGQRTIVWMALAVFLVGDLLLHRTPFGLRVFAVVGTQRRPESQGFELMPHVANA